MRGASRFSTIQVRLAKDSLWELKAKRRSLQGPIAELARLSECCHFQ